MEIIEIYGTKFLRCEKEDCLWNVGHTPHDLNRFGLEFTSRDGVGIRVCDYGNKALAHGKSIDEDCPHKRELCNLLAEYDTSFQNRFWGRVNPEVAKRIFGIEPGSD